MERRIFGLENEYGVTCTLRGQRRLSPDEVARYLFRRVVSWGRVSNVFLANGARLYLDVGSPPRVRHARVRLDLRPRRPRQGGRAHPRAAPGQRRAAPARGGHPRRHLPVQEQHRLGRQQLRLPRELPHQPARRLRPLRRGAHPVPRQPPDLRRRRQGAADRPGRHVLRSASGPSTSGRASRSATTRSRPIINTRDEPHADAERYRRLHVIVGDSNMSEYSTFLKVGAASILLRMLEEPNVVLRDMTLENPIRAIREISHDITCRRRVRLANGREASALEIQSEYLNRALQVRRDAASFSPLETKALEMWEHCLTTIENDPLKLDRECRLGHQAQPDRALPRARRPAAQPPAGGAARPAVPRRQPRPRASSTSMQARGLVERMCDDADIDQAIDDAAADHPGPAARRVHPPGQGAQARLHGRLGAPQAQRPGPAHGAVQGPVQVARRAGREAHRLPLMPSFRRGRVGRIIQERAGLQRVEVHRGADGEGAGEPAYVLTQLTGPVAPGDEVLYNDTAVRARPRHRWLARGARQPHPRRVGRARRWPRAEAPLHQPAGRHRGAGGAHPRRVHRPRRHARGGVHAAQPARGGRGRGPSGGPLGPHRLRHDRRRRAAVGAERPRGRAERPAAARGHRLRRTGLRRRRGGRGGALGAGPGAPPPRCRRGRGGHGPRGGRHGVRARHQRARSSACPRHGRGARRASGPLRAGVRGRRPGPATVA